MSLSRNSSFENIVVNEKDCDPLQFIANPSSTCEQLDLKGLAESARKSIATLRLWQQATGCFHHSLVTAIIDNILVEGDRCHSALKKTVANAQRGQAFADEVVVFYTALANKHGSPEVPNEIVSNLIKAAEKAHRRSIKTRNQLKGVCDTLSKISKDIRLGVELMGAQPILVTSDPEDDIPFNGVNTCFVMFPKSVAALPAKAVSWPGRKAQTWGVSGWDSAEVPIDSDDEDAILDPNAVDPYRASNWGDPQPTVKHLSFANAADQLVRIVRDVSSFVEHFERCVDWWARMKAGLDGLKDTLPGVSLDRTKRTVDLIRGWNGVADQFEIYISRTTPFLTNYLSCIHGRAQNSPRMVYTPLPIVPITPPEVAPPSEAEKPKPLWKKLSAAARS